MNESSITDYHPPVSGREFPPGHMTRRIVAVKKVSEQQEKPVALRRLSRYRTETDGIP